ncbi:hypothetical protein B2J93_6049 [Marssonina coronariae]|uniref:Beta-xylanase n=1 Tax=Diplocarpon coronariae TaxID=2795749 RepID=A0A218YYP2_9HELO|nr:hypothetical protein B2J93_6049 [Marssonina coronariae]
MVFTQLFLFSLFPAAYAQLSTLALAAGLKYFGTATDNPELPDAPYLALLSDTSDFSQITVGNGQKWQYTQKTEGVWSFELGDEIAALAAKNSQLLRCHTLVWHSQLPDWVSSGYWTKGTLQTVMVNHITEEVTHYKGKCYAWDVVNEALDDSAAAAFRDSPFYKAMGEDFLKIAFDAARAADPDVKLYYNDYNIEYTGAKATNALALVTKLVQAGAPIDGVGAQAHYISGKAPTTSDISANLKKYTALGLEVAITELDVRIKLPSTPEKLAQQATGYASTVQACLDVPGCVGITVWDFSDKYSWIPSVSPGDGAANIMDENFAKKPAYYAMVEVLGGQAGGSNSSNTDVPYPGDNTSTAQKPTTTPKAKGKPTTTPEKKPTTAPEYPTGEKPTTTPKAKGKPTTTPEKKPTTAPEYPTGEKPTTTPKAKGKPTTTPPSWYTQTPRGNGTVPGYRPSSGFPPGTGGFPAGTGAPYPMSTKPANRDVCVY